MAKYTHTYTVSISVLLQAQEFAFNSITSGITYPSVFVIIGRQRFYWERRPGFNRRLGVERGVMGLGIEGTIEEWWGWPWGKEQRTLGGGIVGGIVGESELAIWSQDRGAKTVKTWKLSKVINWVGCLTVEMSTHEKCARKCAYMKCDASDSAHRSKWRWKSLLLVS